MTHTLQRWQSHSAEETIAIGRTIAALLPSAAVVLLIGNLGAGKTTLTKGIAQGRGAAEPEDVTSPTFTLIHEYSGQTRMYHIDLYRLDTEREVLTLGLEELYDQDALVLIEWGERFPRLIPQEHWEIRLSADEDTRWIEMQGPSL